MNQWTWNDGWIIMSIYLVQSTESTELCDVLGAADATNHAIPTTNELSHAFSKLSNAGVIEVKENKYIINPSFFKDIEAAYNKKGGLFESGRKGEKWLKKSNLEAVMNLSVSVSEKELKEAYDKYIKIK